MKKKFSVIPVVAIILALLTGILTTLFTTQIILYTTEINGYVEYVRDDGSLSYGYEDTFYPTKKAGKIARLVYSLNPSYENLDGVYSIYSPTAYILGVKAGDTPPSDYLKYCVKYSKLYYETEYIESASPFVPVPVYGTAGDTLKISNGLNYAKALFLDGQTEESKKVFDELTETVKPDFYHFIHLSKDYLYLVYSKTESVTLKQWVLDKEAQLEEMFKDNENIIKYKKNHGALFFNPDYDDYLEMKSPDYDSVEEEAPTVTDEDMNSQAAEAPTP